MSFPTRNTINEDTTAEQVAFLHSAAHFFAFVDDAFIEKHICGEWSRFMDERVRGQLIAMSPLASMAWLVVADHAVNNTPYVFNQVPRGMLSARGRLRRIEQPRRAYH